MKMKKITGITQWSVMTVLLMAAVLTSCTKEEPVALDNPGSTLKCADVPPSPSPMVTCDLIAGKHINVGTVAYSNDDNYMYVTYVTTDGWSLAELHLYVGTEDGLPRNRKGNPVIGHFPYAADDLPMGTTSYTFTVPLEDGMDCYAVAAHAVVYNVNGITETAWAKCEFKPIITLKSWIYNPDKDKNIWAVSDGDPISSDGWCRIMGTNVYEKDATYPLVSFYYNNPGMISVTDDGETLYVTVKVNDNLQLYRTYLYVGTKEGLAEYGICPDYPSFPYSIIDEYSNEHILKVPMPTGNGSTSFEEAFGAKRWGWFSQYCIQ
ncbi:MAG: hypothetical protein J7K46_06015 [Bacteroidales bacterium]|nr:hypothetical protein [Bacteroidales bacterium]